jgi:predicted Zn-dependent protease with MMP-like domain
LPDELRSLLEETPVIVEDAPDPHLLAEMGLDPDEDVLCGLHTGVPLTERSADDAAMPDVIHLFREGIIDEAGGRGADESAIQREIRTTLLHEIGHHFGLDEDDLLALGYD